MPIHSTVVINCAGLGNRLGFGLPKALLQFGGKSILQTHLTELAWHDDIRVVVGFRAEDVINDALQIRRDITFVMNHHYAETGTMASLALGARYGKKRIVSVDGDLLLPPGILTKFCRRQSRCIGITPGKTEEGIKVEYSSNGERKFVKRFVSNTKSKALKMEWSGLLNLPKHYLLNEQEEGLGDEHVYFVIEKQLPIEAVVINCFEIDTPKDYENALIWAKEYF